MADVCRAIVKPLCFDFNTGLCALHIHDGKSGRKVTLLDYIVQFSWAVHIFIGIFLIWVADRVFGISPKAAILLLSKEFRDLARLDWTARAINALGLLCVSV